MLVVGLTGGIGSGKTTVSDMFEGFGITVVDTDLIAREVVEPGSYCLSKICEHFGDDIIEDSGALNRKVLRKIIFEQPQEKLWLEQLLHPEIRKITRRLLSESTSPYTILSSPLLLESPDAEIVDQVLVVDIPTNTQIDRVRNRDQSNIEQIKSIIASQMPREEKLARASEVVDNSKSLEDTMIQVERLHQKFLSLAN